MIRPYVLIMFCISLAFAAYLGFSSVSLGHDKAIHFITFFILTFEFYYLWETHRPWKVTVVTMTLGASILSEYLQNFINPRRTFDYMDIFYNIHGSALAVVASCISQAYFPRWRAHRDTSPVVSSGHSSDLEGFVNIRMSDVGGSG